MRALEAALNAVWAMEEGALETLMAIAAREHEITPEALEAYQAKALPKAHDATIRDGVAIIDVTGTMFRRANLFTAICGGASYDLLRQDLQAAADAGPKGVILNIDSPGGEVNGTAELAQAIFDLREKVPVVAYVGGQGCSAAYWLASAASEVVVDKTAMLGSIGVQMGLRIASPRAGEKSIRFISSQSPMKNADPESEAGAKALQSMVDALGKVFVETVARNRGVATETVLKDFGKGGIFIGEDAVKAGLADATGSFEGVLADLSAGRRRAAQSGRSTRKERVSMSEKTSEAGAEATAASQPAAPAVAVAPAAPAAVDTASAIAEAMAGERKRIARLNTLASAHGVDADKLNAAIEAGTSVEDFAMAIADGERGRAAKRVEALKEDDQAASAAVASSGAEKGEKTADDVAAEMIAAFDAATGE